MSNDTRINTNLFGAGYVSNPRLNAVNTDRQTRFEARAARRWGYWDDFLIFPTPFLWVETVQTLCFGDECVFAPAEVIELWP